MTYKVRGLKEKLHVRGSVWCLTYSKPKTNISYKPALLAASPWLPGTAARDPCLHPRRPARPHTRELLPRSELCPTPESSASVGPGAVAASLLSADTASEVPTPKPLSEGSSGWSGPGAASLLLSTSFSSIDSGGRPTVGRGVWGLHSERRGNGDWYR